MSDIRMMVTGTSHKGTRAGGNNVTAVVYGKPKSVRARGAGKKYYNLSKASVNRVQELSHMKEYDISLILTCHFAYTSIFFRNARTNGEEQE